MSLEVVTDLTSEPVTLEQAKAHLRLDTDDDDQLIVRSITAARQWIEGQTKKALGAKTFTQTVDFDWPWKHGMQWIDFEVNPVTAVTSITYVDGSSPNPTLSADDYIVVARNHNSYVTTAYGVDWPTLRNVPEAVSITFTAGYSTVPEPLKQAVILLVTHMYEHRESFQAGQGQVMVDVPYTIEAMISPYRG